LTLPLFYRFAIIIPSQVFDKTYPLDPKNLGQRLKKAGSHCGIRLSLLSNMEILKVAGKK
jgi:hypothetical protein